MSKGTTRRGEPMEYLLAVLTTDPDCTAGRWPYNTRRKGYSAIWQDEKPRYVATIVCEWYHGPRPEGAVVRHLCGKGQLGCFSPRCLAWGSPVENTQDMFDHGVRTGALTPEQRAEVRARYSGENPPTRRVLAWEYGVSIGTIDRALRGVPKGTPGTDASE